jgi:bacterioferritin-associated ferredoxin
MSPNCLDGMCNLVGNRSKSLRPRPHRRSIRPKIQGPSPIIICSCSGVSDSDVRQAIAWMRPSNPYSLIPPGKIYRALDKSTECGGCIRLFVGRMHSDAQTAVPAE